MIDIIVEIVKMDIDGISVCMFFMFSIESGLVVRDCFCLLEIYCYYVIVYLVIFVSGIVIVL